MNLHTVAERPGAPNSAEARELTDLLQLDDSMRATRSEIREAIDFLDVLGVTPAGVDDSFDLPHS